VVRKQFYFEWLFLISNGGTVCTHYPAGPTLAHVEGFLDKLNGFALLIWP
jgi:hypothetical protein